MKVSIIIPVYNNAAVVPEMLQALFAQEVSTHHGVEVLITDDGSVDHSVSVAQQLLSQCPWSWQVLTGPHVGPATARNRAIDAATGQILLFLQADTILLPDVLAQHIAFHEANTGQSAAALGALKWDPRLNPSPLMEWMTHGGPQNDFDSIVGQVRVDPQHFFYGAHVSLKRNFLGSDRFSLAFTGYGWEDFELGRRLATRGLELTFLSHATVLHQHYYDVLAICRRQQAAGAGLVIYQGLHPNVNLLPERSPLKQILQRLFWALGGLLLLRTLVRIVSVHERSVPWLFSLLCRAEFWYGAQKMNTFILRKHHVIH